MSRHYPTVLLFGSPGSGKGTQGSVLGQLPGCFHLSSGDMFRSLDASSELAKTFTSYSTKGLLVPDDLTIEFWKNYMAQRYDTLEPQPDLLILDGIPRNREQAELLSDHLDVRAIIHLVARNPDAMVERLHNRAIEQGRPDDADEGVIRRRLEVYARETRPVLACYPSELVHEVDALQSPLEVLRDVVGAIIPALVGQASAGAKA